MWASENGGWNFWGLMGAWKCFPLQVKAWEKIKVGFWMKVLAGCTERTAWSFPVNEQSKVEKARGVPHVKNALWCRLLNVLFMEISRSSVMEDQKNSRTILKLYVSTIALSIFFKSLADRDPLPTKKMINYFSPTHFLFPFLFSFLPFYSPPTRRGLTTPLHSVLFPLVGR